jgi:hypothetical protein
MKKDIDVVQLNKEKLFDSLIWIDKTKWEYKHWLIYVELFPKYISFMKIPTCDPKSVKKLQRRCLIPFRFQRDYLTAVCTNTKYRHSKFELFDSSTDWMNYLQYRKPNDPMPTTIDPIDTLGSKIKDIKDRTNRGSPRKVFVPEEFQTQELILMSKIDE